MKKKEPFLYKFMKYTFQKVFSWYFGLKIIGKENIPSEGPIIIAGNHRNYLDPCLPIIASDRVIHFMVKDKYFNNKLLKWFFKGTGCMSVNTNKLNFGAVNDSLNILNDNGVVGIFPEGTRNKTDNLLLPFKTGAVAIAQKINAKIVPFAITGDYKFRKKTLTITFGKPIDISSIEKNEAKEKLFQEVKQLCEINY